MSRITILSLAAALTAAVAPMAQAQSSYPADMSGVVMANVPADDLCQLDGNPALLPAGQALVTAEIEGRPVACGPLLVATNFAVLAPVIGGVLLAGLAAGGNNGGTPDTQ